MHGTAGGAEESGCPICLQSYEPEDRAVISSCLHAFCIGCLQAWCRRSETRLCPLCKRKIVGYIFDIKSDCDYKEHVFDDEELRIQQQPQRWAEVHPSDGTDNHRTSNWGRQVAAPGIADARITELTSYEQRQRQAADGHHDGQRPRIQIRSEPGYTWGDPAEWQRDILQGSRRLNNSSSNHHDSRTAASHDHHDSHLSFGSNRSNRSSSQVVSEARNSGSARGGDGSVAPRPYYWRVQQRMLASVTRLHNSSHEASFNSSAALESRRAIYRNKLWALPHPTALAAAAISSASSNSSSSSMRVSEAALDRWVERELQALLMEQDVTIICAYVKGLVNSFGIQVPNGQQQQQHAAAEVSIHSMLHAASQAATAAVSSSGTIVTSSAAAGSSGGSSSTGTISSPVAALEGFLFEAACHFWHELCCYASSGLTVTAWDRVTRYVPAPQLQQHLLSQQQQQQSTANAGNPVDAVCNGQQQKQQRSETSSLQVQSGTILEQQLSRARDAAAASRFLEQRQLHQQQQRQQQQQQQQLVDRATQPSAADGEVDDVRQQGAGGSSNASSSSQDKQQQHRGFKEHSNSSRGRSDRSASRTTSHRQKERGKHHRSRSRSGSRLRRIPGRSRSSRNESKSLLLRHADGRSSSKSCGSRTDKSPCNKVGVKEEQHIGRQCRRGAAAAGDADWHHQGSGRWEVETEDSYLQTNDGYVVMLVDGDAQQQQHQQQQGFWAAGGGDAAVGFVMDRWQMG